MKYLVAFFHVIILTACCKEKITTQPTGGTNAVPVYNQAYQENYEADLITDIVAKASNAYVLLDPYTEETDVNQYVSQLQSNGNQVAAYISIGTGENWRSDYNQLKPFLCDKEWGQWPGEYFVKETNTGILDIMKARIDQIAAWGYDWIEFDNMDWAFDEKNKSKYNINVTEQQAIDYYNELCAYSNGLGLKCCAKNTVKGATGFDGVLYESYNKDTDWWETADTREFISSGKLVIINHYNECKCNTVYQHYLNSYGDGVSFICEDKKLKKYVHFNE